MSERPRPGIYLSDDVRRQTAAKLGNTLFLDRDGVINVNHGYVCTAERTDWVPGIFELCKMAQDSGYQLVVATNQAGIARGYYTEAEFLNYTKWVHREFARHGVGILATVYCPHHPTAGLGDLRVKCECRKPAPGLFTFASQYLGLDLSRALMIGDKESDLVAATRAGVLESFMIDAQQKRPFDEVQKHLTLASN